MNKKLIKISKELHRVTQAQLDMKDDGLNHVLGIKLSEKLSKDKGIKIRPLGSEKDNITVQKVQEPIIPVVIQDSKAELRSKLVQYFSDSGKNMPLISVNIENRTLLVGIENYKKGNLDMDLVKLRKKLGLSPDTLLSHNINEDGDSVINFQITIPKKHSDTSI